MTQRDKWQKRPAVLRYRDYCDRIRLAAASQLTGKDCYRLQVTAHIAIMPSWSQKRKSATVKTPHRVKPDADNIVKAVSDALFENDSGIWDERGLKYWCLPEDECTEVHVWWYPPKP